MTNKADTVIIPRDVAMHLIDNMQWIEFEGIGDWDKEDVRALASLLQATEVYNDE